MKNTSNMPNTVKDLSKDDIQNTQGGWFDLSWQAFVEEFITDFDINGNGQVGIGCIIGC